MSPRSPKKIAAIVLLLAITGGAFVFYRKTRGESKPLPPTEVTYNQPEQKPTTSPSSLPSSLLIKVPFTPQAPTANWDELHNQACEEASSIMVHAYFDNITSLPPTLVEDELNKLTAWEDQIYGTHLSINTQETARMIEAVYGLHTEVVDNMSQNTVKEALAANKLVIWAGNGRLIGNPNFRTPGPIYHMLVITGWNDKGLITNDPGTRRGLNYQYNYDTLYQASGNYQHDTKETDPADKKIIIISK